MEVLVIVILATVLVIVTLSPAVVVWGSLFQLLPEWYGIKPKLPVAVTIASSIALIVLAEIELEGGTISLFPLLFVGNFGISLLLSPIFVFIRYLQRNSPSIHNN